MKLVTRDENGVLVISLSGRLDTQTSGQASEELTKSVDGVPKVVLNLARLESVSSAGLRIILRLAKTVKGAGSVLRVCGATGVVKAVMEISGFDTMLDLHATEAEALAAF